MIAIKVVPNEFINESRDLREISTLKSLGYEVIVLAKSTEKEVSDRGIYTIRLSSRPLSIGGRGGVFINRLVSIYLWQKKIRELKPEIISCHDIICLFIGWLSTIWTKNKGKLVYDSHEFEAGRNVKRNRLQKSLILLSERFLIRRPQ